MRTLREFREAADLWCRGRLWWPRAPFLLWFAWILVRHLADAEYQSLWKPLNLGIHELGHVLLGCGGEFVSIAGGSLVQCLAPVVSAAMFRRQGDLFAIAVCAGWLSTNLFDVATYAGDARAMQLPIVTPGGGEAIHDWNYLLSTLGLLEWDGAVALALRAAAVATMLASLAAGGWLCHRMARPGPCVPVV